MKYTGVAVGGALVMVWAAMLHDNRAAGAGPTFTRDVAPIMFRRCASCHRPAQAAPMALVSYKDVRPWAQSIKKRVVAREMPPWHADPRFGTFRNDPSLSKQEIATIAAWVDAGAQEGTDALPPVPQAIEGWNHPSGRPPDVILEMPFEFQVPAEGQLPTFYTFSRLPPQLAGEDHFLEAIQLVPGNIPIVHHSSLSMRSLPPGLTLGTARAWPGGPILKNVPVAIDRSAPATVPERQTTAAEAFSIESASHFVFYLPGNNGFAQFAPGVGKRVRHEDYVEWGVHYTPTARVERDRERAGLWLQKVPPTHEMLTLRVGDFHIVNGHEVVLPAGVKTTPGHAAIVSVSGTCDGAPCVTDKAMIPVIPPYADNWKITAMTPFQDDVTLYLAYPHGHLRLKDMTYVVTYPDGREETILSVPRFDFNWQLVYQWSQPIRLPAGSTIKVIGHYDNSARNRWNPAPQREVYWSEQIWDEMFNGFIDLSIDKMDVRREKPPDRISGNR